MTRGRRKGSPATREQILDAARKVFDERGFRAASLRAVARTANRVVGDVSGRTAVIVDDLIDTAGTICGAVRIVLEAGAKDVIVAATHGVLSDPATQRLRESGLRELVVTDTLPIGPEKRFPAMTVLPIAPVLARAIDEVFEDGSVTSLFDGAY